MSKINFFNEETDFSLKQKTKLRSWISSVLNDNHKHLISLNYIYTSDEYLLKINKEYLEEIRDVFFKYPGDSTVEFQIKEDNGNIFNISANSHYRVLPCEDLMGEIVQTPYLLMEDHDVQRLKDRHLY